MAARLGSGNLFSGLFYFTLQRKSAKLTPSAHEMMNMRLERIGFRDHLSQDLIAGLSWHCGFFLWAPL